jgi:rhodanese-related sulfurtransferase
MARRTINQVLQSARRGLRRLDPASARAAQQAGACLVDIRTDSQIAQGQIPGALLIPRNVLEWRLDPDGGHADPRAPGLDAQVIVVCQHGYQSSLAAAALQELGFSRATDLDGGFEAWQAAGLPVVATSRPTEPREDTPVSPSERTGWPE